MHILKASHHQGNPMFKWYGRQCTANSLWSLVKASETLPSAWTTSSLDTILDAGDKLHGTLCSPSKVYLCLSDLPSQIDGMNVNVGHELSGSLARTISELPYFTLEDAVQTIFNKTSAFSKFVFIMGTNHPYNTCAIIRERDCVYFFDPHSRSDTGMMTSNGVACLTKHRNEHDLCLFIRHLAASIKCQHDVQFELSEILLCKESSEPEFSGFSSQSEGEITIKLYLAQEMNINSPSVSDVSSINTLENSDSELSVDSDYVNDVLENLNDSVNFMKSININEFDHVNASFVQEECYDGDNDSDGSESVSLIGNDCKTEPSCVQVSTVIEGSSGISDSDVGHRDITSVEVEDRDHVDVRDSDVGDREVSGDVGDREVSGDVDREVSGDVDREVSGDVDREVIGDVDREVSGDVDREVIGDVDREVIGDVDREVSGDVDREVIGDVDREVSGDVDREVSGDVDREVIGDVDREVSGDVDREVIGDVDREVSGDVGYREVIGDVDVECIQQDIIVRAVNGHIAGEGDVDDVTVSDRNVDLGSLNGKSLGTDEDDLPLIFFTKQNFANDNEEDGQTNLEVQHDNYEVTTDTNVVPTPTQACENNLVDLCDPLQGDERKTGRKRKRDESNWKRNIAKRRRNLGKSYTTKTRKEKPAREIKDGCGDNCRYRCKKKFGSKERETLFHGYWKLGDINMQRQFLTKYAIKKPKTLSTGSSKQRKASIMWTLPSQLQDGVTAPVKVCKTFFLHTLNISDRMVSVVHEKASSIGTCTEDKRGRHNNRPNRTTENQKTKVRQHISSFKTVESHYCRKDSNKFYLPAELNVCKMHNMYQQICRAEFIEPVSLPIYRRIFDYEFNLSFHKPMKDQCDNCVAYKNADQAEKERLKEKHERHIKNKQMARESKEVDKKKQRLATTTALLLFVLT